MHKELEIQTHVRRKISRQPSSQRTTSYSHDHFCILIAVQLTCNSRPRQHLHLQAPTLGFVRQRNSPIPIFLLHEVCESSKLDVDPRRDRGCLSREAQAKMDDGSRNGTPKENSGRVEGGECLVVGGRRDVDVAEVGLYSGKH